MKEYVVTFTTSVQIGPDDFKVVNPSMKVTENTTVKEIEDFYRKHCPKSAVEVKLIELTK